jgi:hypothetical protein
VAWLKGIKKNGPSFDDPFKKDPGDVLLSHTVASAVPSALEGLTSEFGMGSGVTPPPLSPETVISKHSISYAYTPFSFSTLTTSHSGIFIPRSRTMLWKDE